LFNPPNEGESNRGNRQGEVEGEEMRAQQRDHKRKLGSVCLYKGKHKIKALPEKNKNEKN